MNPANTAVGISYLNVNFVGQKIDECFLIEFSTCLYLSWS